MHPTDRTARQNRPDDSPKSPESTTGATMRDVSHTHPNTDSGAINRPFERGPVVAADGGERGAYDEDEEPDDSNALMKDVDHTPPNGVDANRVFERGGKEEPIDSEE